MTLREFAEFLLASEEQILDSDLLCVLNLSSEPTTAARVFLVKEVVFLQWDDNDFQVPLGLSLVFNASDQ